MSGEHITTLEKKHPKEIVWEINENISKLKPYNNTVDYVFKKSASREPRFLSHFLKEDITKSVIGSAMTYVFFYEILDLRTLDKLIQCLCLECNSKIDIWSHTVSYYEPISM